MKKLMILYSVFILLFGFAGFAGAIPMIGDLAVDFRTDDWQGSANAHGSASFSFDGVTAIASGGDGTLFANDSADGLGILGGELDEIDMDEALLIDFGTGRFLTGVWITDLFPEGQGEFGAMQFSYDGNSTSPVIEFNGHNTIEPNGAQYIDFGGSFNINLIIFGHTIADPESEFSVAGFTAAAVPESATMLLLGVGLVGIASVGRKKMIKKQ